MSAGIENQFARQDYLFPREQRRTNFNFDDAFVRGFGDVAQFAKNVFCVAIFQAPDIQAFTSISCAP